jgi:hypothetical protein
MILRFIKLVLGILATLIGVVVIVSIVLYGVAVRTLKVSDYTHFSEIPASTWASLPLSDQTKCADGSDYHAYARRGTSDNLLIHFAGGGACWDGETCSQPITLANFSGYYFPYSWEIVRAISDGVLSTTSANNPFRDWNEVYIPYCTADFHIGQAVNTYTAPDGSLITIHHAGRQNVTEVLAWAYATFAHPAKLMISGESAGGFGSALWTPTIAAHYPESQVYQLSDGVFLQAAQWPQIVDDVWKADTESNFGFTTTNDLAGSAYRHDLTAAHNVTYLHVNTVYDGTLLYFNAKLNGVSDDDAYRETWTRELRQSTAANAEAGANYHYYLTDYGLNADTGTTPHTSISAALFYQITQDGVTLSDWVRRVMDGENVSVGAEFLGE